MRAVAVVGNQPLHEVRRCKPLLLGATRAPGNVETGHADPIVVWVADVDGEWLAYQFVVGIDLQDMRSVLSTRID
jgi:hypothetical protein